MGEKKCLVIIPAYNEQNNIVQVLDGIKEFAPDVDILVINDSSKDQTEQVVREAGVPVLSHCTNLGYSGAILTGYKYAIAHNYEYVIQFDGDGQHDPREIHKLMRFIETEDQDIVIGSRFIEKTEYRHGALRGLGTSVFTSTIKLFTGYRITDPTSGLQILNRRAFRYYVTSGNFPEYPDANVLILMLRLGFKIKEMPVLMHDRLSGVGMHDSPIKNVKYMVSMFYSIFVSLLKGNRKGVKQIGL